MSELQAEGAKLVADLKKLPWWAYPIAGGVALGGVYYAKQHGLLGSSGAKSAPATTATPQPEYQPPDGLSMSDLAGLPYDYYDWSAAITPGGQPLPTTTGTTDTTTSGTPGSTTGSPAPDPTPAPILVSGNENPPPPAPYQPVRKPGQPAPSTPAPQVYHHTVEPFPAWDSTLSGIGHHYGMSWQQLYNYGNDRSIVDSAAHAHGHYGDEYNWLFPGEVLEVPSPN